MQSITQFSGQVSAAFTGGTYHGNFYFNLGKRISPRRLSSEDIEELRAVYVSREDVFPRAVAAARDRGAVILCAEPGTGRRITAVNVAIDLGVSPEWLDLDRDDVHASLPVQQNRAYLLNLQENDPEVIPAVGKELINYVVRLREVGSYLVVLATEQELRELDLSVAPEIVKLQASDALEVFIAHLTRMCSHSQAQEWSANEQIREVLASASPQNAVTLAEYVRESGSASPEGEGVQRVLAAYQNWDTDLKGFFAKTCDTDDVTHGYQRALLLSIAALEGADATEIFAAANALCEAIDIPHLPGRGLLGPGITNCLTGINARYADRRINFTLPRYGTAVMDYIWQDRPHFRDHLTTWLQGLQGDRPLELLLHLAVRHAGPDLVLKTAEKRAKQDRERVAIMLTAAAMSDELGRAVRSRMYDWAQWTGAEPLHLVVADVCGGRLIDRFDQIALTRLRHLARQPSERVREAVIAALANLAARRPLRVRTLREILNWINATEHARSTGLQAFVALARLRDQSRLTLMPRSTEEHTLIDVLGQGWRLSLRAPEVADTAKEAAIEWLEDAARDAVEREIVYQVLLSACRSNLDIGVLASLVWRWAKNTSADGVDRESLGVELMRRIGKRDALTPDAPLIDFYQNGEESV